MDSDIKLQAPRFSMVIPAYNEEDYLPALLDTVDVARSRYSGGTDAIEIIVADNSSTDSTAEIAQSRGCRVAHVEKRAIAAARNGGAAIARGEIFAFIDADSKIHPETFNAIERAISGNLYVGGATGVHMERMSPGIAIAYAIMVPMVRIMGMDTGVVFCRRKDFETIGGYNEDRIFAEDVEFLLALRKLGRSRRQRLCRITEVKAITSTRKWDKHGEWHYIKLMLSAAVYMLFSPKSMERVARKYWYDNPR